MHCQSKCSKKNKRLMNRQWMERAYYRPEAPCACPIVGWTCLKWISLLCILYYSTIKQTHKSKSGMWICSKKLGPVLAFLETPVWNWGETLCYNSPWHIYKNYNIEWYVRNLTHRDTYWQEQSYDLRNAQDGQWV